MKKATKWTQKARFSHVFSQCSRLFSCCVPPKLALFKLLPTLVGYRKGLLSGPAGARVPQVHIAAQAHGEMIVGGPIQQPQVVVVLKARRREHLVRRRREASSSLHGLQPSHAFTHTGGIRKDVIYRHTIETHYIYYIYLLRFQLSIVMKYKQDLIRFDCLQAMFSLPSWESPGQCWHLKAWTPSPPAGSCSERGSAPVCATPPWHLKGSLGGAHTFPERLAPTWRLDSTRVGQEPAARCGAGAQRRRGHDLARAGIKNQCLRFKMV